MKEAKNLSELLKRVTEERDAVWTPIWQCWLNMVCPPELIMEVC